MEKLDVFQPPTDKDDAYRKWRVATRMLKLLVAAGLVADEDKLAIAEEIASWEDR